MEEDKKKGYLAGGIFLVVGIILSFLGIDNGWASGKLMIVFGSILSLLGLGGIWKPDTIGQVIAHYLKQLSEKQKGDSISQKQDRPTKSPQAIAKDNANLNIYYNSKLPDETPDNEIKELKKEINSELSKEKLSNILIKCIRLADLIHSKKDRLWLEKEAYGFDKIDEKSVPDYRTIKTEVRFAHKSSPQGYFTLDFNLTFGHPIFQIEDWVEKYEKMPNPREMSITGPLTKDFIEVFKETFKKEPPDEEIPYIIPVSELKKILNGLKLRISKFVNSIKA